MFKGSNTPRVKGQSDNVHNEYIGQIDINFFEINVGLHLPDGFGDLHNNEHIMGHLPDGFGDRHYSEHILSPMLLLDNKLPPGLQNFACGCLTAKPLMGPDFERALVRDAERPTETS